MPSPDETELAQLDIDYQSAVERNDAPTMDRILLDGMVLVTVPVGPTRRRNFWRRPGVDVSSTNGRTPTSGRSGSGEIPRS
jgi:hypothetical protein